MPELDHNALAVIIAAIAAVGTGSGWLGFFFQRRKFAAEGEGLAATATKTIQEAASNIVDLYRTELERTLTDNRNKEDEIKVLRADIERLQKRVSELEEQVTLLQRVNAELKRSRKSSTPTKE